MQLNVIFCLVQVAFNPIFFFVFCPVTSGAENEKSEEALERKRVYCGSRLTTMLSQYCSIYNGPSDYRRRRAISDECCLIPCSLQYVLSSYCHTINGEALKKYEEGFLERNIRRRKHIRKRKPRKRKKRNCTCKKDREHNEMERRLLSRTVPEYIIGYLEHGNNPIVIDESWMDNRKH